MNRLTQRGHYKLLVADDPSAARRERMLDLFDD
jgi:hypothetical protein